MNGIIGAHLLTVITIISYLFIHFSGDESNKILKFPDFSLTFSDFPISLTILQNSLTFP